MVTNRGCPAFFVLFDGYELPAAKHSEGRGLRVMAILHGVCVVGGQDTSRRLCL